MIWDGVTNLLKDSVPSSGGLGVFIEGTEKFGVRNNLILINTAIIQNTYTTTANILPLIYLVIIE